MPEEKELGHTAFVLSFFQGLLFLFISFLVGWVLSWNPQNGVLPFVFIALAIGYSIAPLNSLYSAYLEKRLNYKNLSLLKILAGFMAVATSIVLAFYGFGIWSLVSSELVIALVSLIGYRIFAKTEFHWRFQKKLALKLFGFSRKMMLAVGLEKAVHQIDNFLVGKVLGVNLLGYYNQGRRLTNVANAAVTPVIIVSFPLYAALQQDEERVRKSHQLISFALVRLMIPVTIVFWAFPHDLVTFLFGEKWRLAGSALRCLALYPLLVPEFEALKNLLYGLGRISTVAWIRAFQLLLGVPLILFGMHIKGFQGAAIGYVSSIFVGSVLLHFVARKYVKGSFLKTFFYPLLAGSISLIFTYQLKQLVFDTSLTLRVIELLITSLTSYFGVLWIFERSLLKAYFYNLKKRLGVGRVAS